MEKSQNQNLRAVSSIIFMLAASPLAVTYVDADLSEENVDAQTEDDNTYAIAFIPGEIKNPQTEKHYNLVQMSQVTVESFKALILPV